MKTRRILSTILAIVLVVSTFTFGSFNVVADTAAPMAVYVADNGDDSADGSQAAPLKSFAKAVELVADGGTIYIAGSYNYTGSNSSNMYPFPVTDKKITVEGVDSSSVFQFPQAGAYQGDPQMTSDYTFRNIKLNILRGGGGFFTNGSKTTFAGNISLEGGSIFIGNLASTTASEHIVFTDGLQINQTFILGNGTSTLVSGNVTLEAKNGSRAPGINLVQMTSWTNTSDKGTVGGDLRVKVDATSQFTTFMNDQQKTTFNGSYMQIVEEGAAIHTPDAAFLSAFKNNGISATGYYKVVVKNPQGGSVDFSQQTGKVDIIVNDGYVAKVERAGETFYTDSVVGLSATFGNGVETVVTFENDKAFVGDLDVLIAPATPEKTEFPVSWQGAGADGVTVSVAAVSPSDVVVDYSKRYTYTVKIQANAGFVFTDDFEFEINGKDRYVRELSDIFDEDNQYRISNLSKSYSEITFDYKVEATKANVDINGKPNEFTLEYNGGVGSAVASGKTAPDIAGYDIKNKSEPEETWTAGDVTVAAGDIFVKKGYQFKNYYYLKDGVKVPVGAGSEFELTQNTVLYVEWEALPSISINFQSNGATWGFMSGITNKYDGDVITLPFCDYAAPIGSHFTGWLSNYDGNIYQPGDQFAIPDIATIPVALSTSAGATLSFIPQWTPRTDMDATYYVSTSGDDENNDGTPSKPFASIIAAAEKAKDQNAYIVIMDSAILTGLKTASTYQLTIVGANENSVLKVTSSISFKRPTRIENIHLDVSSGAYVYTNGYKAEFGPNLPNKSKYFKLNIADGAEGGEDIEGTDTSKTVLTTTITEKIGVNTTINPGVDIGNYNFGGKYAPGKVIHGNSYVTFNNGVKVDVIDISSVNSTLSKSVLSDGNITFSVNADVDESFKSTTKVQNIFANPDYKLIVLFNNGSYPGKLGDTFVSDQSFIVDAGPGGSGAIVDYYGVRFFASQSFVYATASDVFSGAGYTSGSGSFMIDDNQNYETNNKEATKVRFGQPVDVSQINLDFLSQPTAGVHTSVVAAPTVLDSAASICYANFDEKNPWTPEVDKQYPYFGYDKQYTANLVITPMTGYFFDDFNMGSYVFTVEGDVVPAVLNPDGTVSVSYMFPTYTSYEAPEINVNFFSEGVDIGYTPAETPVHLGNITLPPVPTNKPFIKYFGGWRDEEGNIWPASSTYHIVSNVDTLRFDAEWITYCSVNFPTVLLLYDYSSQAADLGRNPKFQPTDSPILTVGTLSNLEYAIGGSTVIPSKKFDRESTTYIESDGSENPMWINETSLSSNKINAGEYKYMTIVYYYKTKAGKAVGNNGKMTFGYCILPDGSTSEWFAHSVKSEDKVVANKWATMTFDLTDAIESNDVPDDAKFAQFHILPIGDLPCSKLEGDTLYMKALYFSKEPPITSEEN